MYLFADMVNVKLVLNDHGGNSQPSHRKNDVQFIRQEITQSQCSQYSLGESSQRFRVKNELKKTPQVSDVSFGEINQRFGVKK